MCRARRADARINSKNKQAVWTECERLLLARRTTRALFVAAAAPDINPQALDLLIQGGKRDQKALRGFGLVPAAPFEHVHDDASLDFVNDLEEGGARMIRGRSRTRLPGERRQKIGNLNRHTPTDLSPAN